MSLAINISREDFLAGLSPIQNVTGKKGTIAILSNVLIQSSTDALILTATDLEVGIRNTVPAEIISPGAITLPARKLFEIIRESNVETINLEELENNWVKIKANKTNYNLAGMPAEEFPTFPEYSEENIVAVESKIIKELIDKTIFSVAQEGENQFNLTGVLVEKKGNEDENFIRMISSDGHRLTLMETGIEGDVKNITIEKNTIIPRKGVLEIRKFCEANEKIKIGFEKKQAVVKTDNSLLIIRLMNGDFPDYNNIINVIDKENYFRIDKLSFLNSMKRMNLFTEDRFNAVKFDIHKKVLILSSQNMDIGNAKDEIDIEFTGDSFTLGFNGKYFVDTLQAMNSDEIIVYINSEESPCLLKAEDDPGFLSVIMPMKI